MVTFRLADSLPRAVAAELGRKQIAERDAARHERVEAFLDSGKGDCYLANRNVARIVEETLLRFDGERYKLLAWVVMPNHIHVVVETAPEHPLAEVIHSWKSFTSHAGNRILGRSGTFWQREYFDRAIRDERHLRTSIDYIHENPCKAGLVDAPELWQFSSAGRFGARAGEAPAPPEARHP